MINNEFLLPFGFWFGLFWIQSGLAHWMNSNKLKQTKIPNWAARMNGAYAGFGFLSAILFNHSPINQLILNPASINWLPVCWMKLD